MACLVLRSPTTLRLIPSADGGFRYELRPGEQIVGISYSCAPQPEDNFESIVTSDGLMLGNLVKKITSTLGIKQCLRCKGRQRRLNEIGLVVQRKLGL